MKHGEYILLMQRKRWREPVFASHFPACLSHDHISDPCSYIWTIDNYCDVYRSICAYVLWFLLLSVCTLFLYILECISRSTHSGDKFLALIGSQRWSISSPCSLFIWFCNHSPHCSCQGCYISSYKEAGKSLCYASTVRLKNTLDQGENLQSEYIVI